MKKTPYERMLDIKTKKAMSGVALSEDFKSAIDYAREAKHFVAMKVSDSLDKLVDTMIKKAINGDVMAFVALMDRAHGKPAQAVEMTGKDGNPIVFMPLELINKYTLTTPSKPIDVNKDVVSNTVVSKDVVVEPLK